MTISFAWTPGQGSYKHYPPYVNLTGNRLTVRGPEKLDGEHPAAGNHVAVELPPEAIDELRAALTRPTTLVTDEVVERVNAALRENLTAQGLRLVKDVNGQSDVRHIGDGMIGFDELARAALASMPTVVTGEQPETLESISAWCDETFGTASPLRMAARANEEMAELIDVASRAETYSEKVLIEAADVLICLARFPGLWAAVERKMSINRSRVWRLTGEGTGYHVPEPPAQPGDA